MSGIALGIGAISIGAGIFSSISAKKSRDKAHALAEKNMIMQNNIAKENLKLQKEEAAKLEKQKNSLNFY